MDLLFSLALAAIFAWALFSAQGFRRQARLFPTVIGVAGLLLAVAVLVLDFRQRRIMRTEPSRSASASPAGEHVAPAHPEPRVYPEPSRREGPSPAAPPGSAGILPARHPFIAIWAWIIAFVAAIWLLGFMIAVPVATFAYLRFGARESLLTSGLFAIGCGAVFYAMFGQLVRIPFDTGLLVGLLDG